MVVFRSQAQRTCTQTLKMSYSDVDLTLNHLFHGYITDVSCHFHVRWWRFESQSFSWAHYRWAMSDVGDLNLITDFMGTLHISHVRCWWFESQSVIQWVLCRWTKCWQCCHGVSPSHRRSSCCQCWGKSFKEAGTPGWCLALIRSDSYRHRKTNIGLEYRYKAV